MRVYAATVKKAVIDRDTDLLTKDEMIQHRTLVTTGILEELNI